MRDRDAGEKDREVLGKRAEKFWRRGKRSWGATWLACSKSWRACMYLRSTSCSLSILVLRRNPDSTASACRGREAC
eukprot:2445443-Rhodomonas_salina.1